MNYDTYRSISSQYLRKVMRLLEPPMHILSVSPYFIRIVYITCITTINNSKGLFIWAGLARSRHWLSVNLIFCVQYANQSSLIAKIYLTTKLACTPQATTKYKPDFNMLYLFIKYWIKVLISMFESMFANDLWITCNLWSLIALFLHKAIKCLACGGSN